MVPDSLAAVLQPEITTPVAGMRVGACMSCRTRHRVAPLDSGQRVKRIKLAVSCIRAGGMAVSSSSYLLVVMAKNELWLWACLILAVGGLILLDVVLCTMLQFGQREQQVQRVEPVSESGQRWWVAEPKTVSEHHLFGRGEVIDRKGQPGRTTLQPSLRALARTIPDIDSRRRLRKIVKAAPR
eukprot:8819393-Pyramimonas_sp.AAC.1